MTIRATRAVLAALLTVPVSGVLLVATAPAALAGSGSITKPAVDASFSSGDYALVEASVTLSKGQAAQMKVTGPGLGSGRITSRTNTCTSLTCPSSQTFTLSDPRVPISSAQPNGEFTVTLTGDVATSSRHFYTNFAPSTPSGLAAKGTGASKVDLTWDYTGSEPDLTGFVIADDKGNTFPLSDPSARTYTTYYTNPEPGSYDYAFSIKALRKNGKGDGTVAGESSGSATAQLVTPQPPPSPTPAPSPTAGSGGSATPGPGSSPAPGTGGSTGGGTGGGSTGGGTGGGTTGGSGTGGSKTDTPKLSLPSLSPVAAQRRNYALSFNSFSPSLGIPKLPPLPATTFSNVAGDTFQPTLPYDSPSAEQEEGGNLITAPLSTVTSLDSEQLAKNLAFALILLVAGAHVRLFLSSHKAD